VLKLSNAVQHAVTEIVACLAGGVWHEIPIPNAQEMGWRVEQEFIGAIRGTEKVQRTDFYTGVQYMEFTGWPLAVRLCCRV
jgi:hypothetical protein